MNNKSTWLTNWNPEDEAFWNSKGKKNAWKTLTITTISLTFSFCVWYIISTIAPGLPFSESEKFLLISLFGLSAGIFRIIHTFLIPIYGSRHVITVSTLIKLIPVVGLFYAVMDPQTPFWVYCVLSFLTGFGGGDFSSYMPSTNLFFPARLKGTALGIQAGIGNFGVGLVQLLTPLLLGVAIVGAPQIVGDKKIYLQSAIVIYIPILLVLTLLCWTMIRSVPVKASFKDQLDIFSDKHTWFCTITYFMTFGTFAGLSAVFPMLMKSLYAPHMEDLNPLKYAFYGPIIASTSRVLFGFIADKVGGAILTTIAGIGLIVCTLLMVSMGLFAPTAATASANFPYFVGLIYVIFFFTGIGNASTFRQFPIIFKDNPRQASGVIGWTAAIASFGPFVFSYIMKFVIASSAAQGLKSAASFFIGLVFFLIIATVINWYYYQRKGSERPS